MKWYVINNKIVINKLCDNYSIQLLDNILWYQSYVSIVLILILILYSNFK
jgi:hypothetical protein